MNISIAYRPTLNRPLTVMTSPTIAMNLSGCSGAPSQNILGSYFPSWLLCAVVGLIAAIVVRQGLVALGVDKSLPAPLLIYLALTVAFAFAGWLIWLA